MHGVAMRSRLGAAQFGSSLAALTAILLAGTSGANTPALACELYANQPEWSGVAIAGVGGRFVCADVVRLTVLLRQDRPWWPDVTLNEASYTGTNKQLTVTYSCRGFVDKKVYVETRTNTGGKKQSPRAYTQCG